MEEVERDIGANDISQLLSPVFLQKIYLTGEDRLKTQFNRQLYIPLRRRKSTPVLRRNYVFFLLQFLFFFFFFPSLLESLFKMLPVRPQKERERREVCEKETSPLKRVLLPSLSLLSIGKYHRSIGRRATERKTRVFLTGSQIFRPPRKTTMIAAPAHKQGSFIFTRENEVSILDRPSSFRAATSRFFDCKSLRKGKKKGEKKKERESRGKPQRPRKSAYFLPETPPRSFFPSTTAALPTTNCWSLPSNPRAAYTRSPVE